MEQNLRTLVSKVRECYSILEKLNHDYRVAKSNGKKGSCQSLIIQIKNCKSRLQRYQNTIKAKVNTNYIKVIYSVDDILDEGTFINLSPDEIEDLIRLYHIGKKISILEYKEIQSYISKYNL